MAEWSTRPLEEIYAAIFIDTVPSRSPRCGIATTPDSRVDQRPVYAAIGLDLSGHKTVLGLWAASGDEAATPEFWMSMHSELKNRGVADVFFVVHAGLERLPDAVTATFPQAVVQISVLHLLHITFQHAPAKDWGKLAADLKQICGAPTRESAERAFERFETTWSATFPAIGRLWRDAWKGFAPFLDYDIEIRKILCSTDGSEPLNAHHRRTVNVRGHLPAEQAALNCLYLATRSLDPRDADHVHSTVRWEPALAALTTTFTDRMPPAEDT